MPKPFSIKIFLEDGTPEGVRTVTKSNWDGCCVVCPRSRYADIRSRPEFACPGVYVLYGTSQDSNFPVVYVGEGDPVQNRLDGHLAKKDFWTTAYVFVSSAHRLNKAHIQHLESELVRLAQNLKRAVLDNGNSPQLPTLTPVDRADADLFLDEMLLVLPALGISAFDVPIKPREEAAELFVEGKGVKARGILTSGGVVVLAGSGAVKQDRPSSASNICEMRARLQKTGVLIAGDSELKFTQDFEFTSPSMAASVVFGGNTNGRTAWRDKQGRTLQERETSAAGSN